jgi:pilus assembly protein CpaC
MSLRGAAAEVEEAPKPQAPGNNFNFNFGQQVPTAPPVPRIINLLRVPGPQQVMLKVQIAELNRTALRRIGFAFLFQDSDTVVATAAEFARLLNPLNVTQNTTAFAIFDGGDVNIFVDALRRNRVFKILAEPNLVAMNGQQATFLAGGEFPVPVPQSGGAGISAQPTVTIQYKEFGVKLGFTPMIHDDETIRLQVAPEVSSIDFDLGILVAGTRVPALNTRRANTVVQIREGQTLAMAGLLQLEISGRTDRIPGLGDLPYIGPFFSNTSSEKVEKELVVLVTPYLVDAVPAEEVPPVPGAEMKEPTDFEMYLLNRIEGRTCEPFRSTTAWEDPLGLHGRQIHIEQNYVIGPHGYSQ